MLSSSAQASLSGRFEGSVYGESKLAGEGLFREYSGRTGAPVLIYRFPNLYGKWCRPRYNSAVATFCDAIANGRPYAVNDPSVELELLYIDDLVGEMLGALLGREHRCGYDGLERVDGDGFCYVPDTDVKTLGEIVHLLDCFRDSRETLSVPDLSEGSFSKKLWSTFLSYYEPGNFAYGLKPNTDARGSFTEFLRTPERGQVSINVSRPGITKGNHWHMSKWERFLVVSGTASIKLRKVGEDADGNPFPVDEYTVSGSDMRAVEMIPGYTHSITNLSDTEDLVTVMWPTSPSTPRTPTPTTRRSSRMGKDYSDIAFRDDGRLKLLIIVGTRPEVIRLSEVIKKCRRHFDCLLAHTGQNYDYTLNGIFFRDLELADPDVYLDAVGADLGETVGNIIAASYKLMVQVKPDAF